MDNFLKDQKLEHLCDALSSSLTITDAMALLDQGRPKLLEKLKELGVNKLPERQAVAKAIANGKRDLLGLGKPVVFALYSTGLKPDDGAQLMQPLLDALSAAGFTDSITLDFWNEPPYQGKVSTNEEYAKALRDTIYAKGDFKGRPLLILGHSNGAMGGYGLARLLQNKVRAFVVLGRRPPTQPLLPDSVQCETTAEVHALSLHTLAQRMSVSYANPALKMYTAPEDDATWQPQVKAAVEAARDQYGSACVLGTAADIEASVGPLGGAVPASAKISCAVHGVAAKQETAAGETNDKMEGWAALTTSSFGWLAREVGCSHMDLPKDEKTLAVVVEALKPHLSGEPVAVS